MADTCCGTTDATRTPSVVVQSIHRPAKPTPCRDQGTIPPASYGKTLSPYLTQVKGILATFASTQMLRTNLLPGVEGDYLGLQIVDSSDGNSVSTFNYQRGYARIYFLFTKKDGTAYEAQWPSSTTIITV